MFHLDPPLTADQRKAVTDSKEVIYDGFRQALSLGVPAASAGVLVDEEFGADILRDASRNGYATVLSTERSGSDEFEFEYGAEFASHIAAFKPTFAKALVRYNPEGDAALNQRQTARLKQLSDYCRAVGQRFMFELLVPPTTAQRNRVDAFDSNVRSAHAAPLLSFRPFARCKTPELNPMSGRSKGSIADRTASMSSQPRVAAAGVKSGALCLGGMPNEIACCIGCETAASVPGFIGFAIGRTTFWDAVAAYVAKQVTRHEAAWLIARRYREWATVFEQGRHSRAGAA